MRCKKHYIDLSSTVGVCACCLRERLFSLAEEQTLAHLQNLNSDKNPAIPRSVSPYNHDRRRNRSDGASACSDNYRRTDHHHQQQLRYRYPPSVPHHRHSISDQLFYTTPQVAPVSGGHNTGVDSNKKRSFIRFLSFSNIFRSRNRKSVDSVSDLQEPDSTFREQYAGVNVNATSRHRRKQSVVDESTVTATGGAVRRHYCRDRGMSPVRNSDVDVEEFNNARSEYESTESWRNTPRRTPARRGGGGVHARNLSGLTFCLSPLVRASPNRQWNQKGLPPDVIISGEIRAPVNATKLFNGNRSRKLADFGRSNQNR